MSTKRLYAFLVVLLTIISNVQAQPSAVKNIAKSVFTLNTYKADGTLLATSHGIFIGENGEAISDLKPFKGASTAKITDQKGVEMNVTRMLGINDIYDIARFRVDGKTTPAPIANTQSSQGSNTWLVGSGKSPTITEGRVKSVETFMNKYNYYILAIKAPDGTTACPFVNANGEVIGLMQMSATTFDTYATDTRFAQSLTLNGMSYTDSNIRQIGIPIAMPNDLTQAQLTMMMAGQSGDSLKYEAAVNDMMVQFPNQIDGYEARARLQMQKGLFDQASETMETALKKVEGKDEVHYNLSKLIFDKEIYMSSIPYEPWSLDKALQEAETAYGINPLSIYKHLQAQIIFSKQEYQRAYDMLRELYDDKSLQSPELLYEQARCRQQLGAEPKEIIALLDSAINTTDTLQMVSAAPYFLARAGAYEQADSFRQAVFDYTRYEYLMQGQVNANFYYIREQAEVKSRLFQQALTDIARAIILAPNEPTYYAEMASLQLRVNHVDQALQTAERCTHIAPEYSDGFLLLGLAQVRKGDKTSGLANMQKAKELGNSQADALIDKYSK